MKVSCTHFQCAAGAFTYLRNHFPHSYSVDMSHQILNLNINLMLVRSEPWLWWLLTVGVRIQWLGSFEAVNLKGLHPS